MPTLSNATSQMFVLFLITIVGYLAAKLHILDKVAQEKITRLVFYISQPSMIIAGITQMESSISGATILLCFGLGIVQFSLLLGCGVLCAILLRVPKDERPVYLFMSIFTNTNFIGLPVIVSLYGQDSTIYASTLILSILLLTNFIGFPMLMNPEQRKKKAKLVKEALNPPALGSLIGLAIFFAGIELPGFVDKTLSMIGQITPPAAMIVVGIIVSYYPIKQIFTQMRIYPFILIRMIAMPCAAYLVLHLFISDPMLLGAFTMLAAMPVGALAPAFVAMYGRNPSMVASATIVTTIASFAVIPLMMLIMTMA